MDETAYKEADFTYRLFRSSDEVKTKLAYSYAKQLVAEKETIKQLKQIYNKYADNKKLTRKNRNDLKILLDRYADEKGDNPRLFYISMEELHTPLLDILDTTFNAVFLDYLIAWKALLTEQDYFNNYCKDNLYKDKLI
jgi:hypothetical protein